MTKSSAAPSTAIREASDDSLSISAELPGSTESEGSIIAGECQPIESIETSLETSLNMLDSGLEAYAREPAARNTCDSSERHENDQNEHDQHERDQTGDNQAWPAGFRLSVVIPVFNEEATLELVIDRVLALDVPKEIVIVDDCSTDGTPFILARFEKRPNIQVIYSPTNQSKGAAVRSGIKQAKGDIIVVQDADLEYNPNDILGLLDPILADDADVVYGSRFLGARVRDRSLLHRLGNKLLTWASNRTTGLKLTDMETCYKAFGRDAIGEIQLEQDRFGFEPEVTAKLAHRGMRFSEVPVDYEARGYDEGKKIGIRDLFNAAYCIWRYRKPT